MSNSSPTDVARKAKGMLNNVTALCTITEPWTNVTRGDVFSYLRGIEKCVDTLEQFATDHEEGDAEIRTDYTRNDLIYLCVRGFVQQDKWSNRDSAKAQVQLAQCYALLWAGCKFHVPTADDAKCMATTADTVWVDVSYQGFSYFEEGILSTDTFYIPTERRLDEANGEDWY